MASSLTTRQAIVADQCFFIRTHTFSGYSQCYFLTHIVPNHHYSAHNVYLKIFLKSAS